MAQTTPSEQLTTTPTLSTSTISSPPTSSISSTSTTSSSVTAETSPPSVISRPSKQQQQQQQQHQQFHSNFIYYFTMYSISFLADNCNNLYKLRFLFFVFALFRPTYFLVVPPCCDFKCALKGEANPGVSLRVAVRRS